MDDELCTTSHGFGGLRTKVSGWLLGAALVGLLLLSPVEVGAATKQVGVRDRSYDPDKTSVRVGDVVTWQNAGSADPHNVRQDRLLFRSGDPELKMDYSVRFSAGTFHYFCEIHGGPRSGMDGKVFVPVTTAAAPAGPTFSVIWATSATRSGSRFDVQYRIGSGDWRTWHQDTRRFKGTFGDGGSPEVAVPGTRYRFRARSQKGSMAKAVSDWSPVVSFTP